jgi:hypothetical protein
VLFTKSCCFYEILSISTSFLNVDLKIILSLFYPDQKRSLRNGCQITEISLRHRPICPVHNIPSWVIKSQNKKRPVLCTVSLKCVIDRCVTILMMTFYNLYPSVPISDSHDLLYPLSAMSPLLCLMYKKCAIFGDRVL